MKIILLLEHFCMAEKNKLIVLGIMLALHAADIIPFIVSGTILLIGMSVYYIWVAVHNCRRTLEFYIFIGMNVFWILYAIAYAINY